MIKSKKNSVSHKSDVREKSSSWLAADRFIPQRRDSNLSDYNRISLKEILDMTESSEEEKNGTTTIKFSKILKDNFTKYNSPNSKTLFKFKPEISNEIDFKKKKEEVIKKRHKKKISKKPYKILEAPGFENNYYHNILSWSVTDLLAVSLSNSIYILNNKTNETRKLYEAYNCEEISSVEWNRDGDKLAVGNVLGEITIWDVNKKKDIQTLDSHEERIGTLSWEKLLLSGSKDKKIALQDIRMPSPKISTFNNHQSEVCKVKFSPCGEIFASGGNDNKLNIWSLKTQIPYFKGTHNAGIRALTWSQNQFRVLFSGGGQNDGEIKAWNVDKKENLWSRKTDTQICSLLALKETNDIISGGGFPNFCVTVWRGKSGKKVCHLKGHSQRVLEMGIGPEGKRIVTGSGDETLRFWRVGGGGREEGRRNFFEVGKPLR